MKLQWPPDNKPQSTLNFFHVCMLFLVVFGNWRQNTSGKITQHKRDTLQETNIAPENWPSQKEISSSNHWFSRAMLVWGRVHSRKTSLISHWRGKGMGTSYVPAGKIMILVLRRIAFFHQKTSQVLPTSSTFETYARQIGSFFQGTPYLDYSVILRILGVLKCSSFTRTIHENPWLLNFPPISQGTWRIIPWLVNG